MKFSPFDFDVVSGPPEPREERGKREDAARPASPAGAGKKEGAKESAEPAPAK